MRVRFNFIKDEALDDNPGFLNKITKRSQESQLNLFVTIEVPLNTFYNSGEWRLMEMVNQFAGIRSCSCEALVLGRFFVWADEC